MGLWPLYLKRTVISTAALAVPYDVALAAIQDVPTMITLNPLVSTYEVKPDDPSTYIITDTLKLLHFFTRRTKYTINTELEDNGITFLVKAEGGMTSTNYWKVCRREDATTVEVVEESHIEAPFFFIVFVTSTVKKTHRVLMDRLAAKLEGRQKQTVPHSNWWANNSKSGSTCEDEC
ncbi:hypothetical protein M0805_003392 [Coniferiporia weirii]|nr:hypothetical protein M0805_003392 [Coniferiporia weirii]